MNWLIGYALLCGIACVLVMAFMRGANAKGHTCATCGDPAHMKIGGKWYCCRGCRWEDEE